MNIVSLFCGAGGLDLGLKLAGHKVIWANDSDGDCVKSYCKNIGGHVVAGDIQEIPSSAIPDADCFVGGFPCQGFSMANLRRSTSDERNKLYAEFLRVVTDKQPMYFLAENVRGLLSLGRGKVIAKIIRDFERAGYHVTYQLFNMADYGVPQTRRRVIIAGTRKDLQGSCDFVFPSPTHSRDADPSGTRAKHGLLPWVTISQGLAGIPEPGQGSDLPNHICSQYKVTNRNFTGHRRTDPDKPSPTILARGNGKGGVCAIQHPRNHRRLSIRESAIVQTFPLQFEFVGAMNSCYRQVGNAVPVLFSKRLGEQLKHCEARLKRCE
ncbi:MAG: DNA cytosine methyltransferase [Acidobacteriota bacterium]|nr:DNA cytosine methyltransferase [Acidobacteriota bacterium]